MFYDAECLFCVACVKRWGGLFARRGFEWLPLQTPGAAMRLGVTAIQLREVMWLQLADGRTHGGVDAWARLFRAVWWLWLLGALLSLPGFRWVGAFYYRHIALNRHCLGEMCGLHSHRSSLPTPCSDPGSAMKRRMILAGGSGFLGGVLAKHFTTLKWEVVVLTRHPKPRSDGLREVAWDGETVGNWARELEGAEAVVNLCGKSVDCRYTGENRKLLINSRTLPTRAIGQAIANCQSPPRVWLNSSSATLYKHTFDTAMDENGAQGATREAKDEFSIEIIRQWECALNEAQTPRTRKVALRTTMVLGMSRNSVVPVLRRLTRLGLGGRMGSGRQFVSWMHQEDFCRAVEWVITHDELSGPVNLAAPKPLPNAEMMRTFRKQCGVPIGLPATEWMLEIGAVFLRTETELIIKSRRVVPGRLLASGFEFRFPQFREALANTLGETSH